MCFFLLISLADVPPASSGKRTAESPDTPCAKRQCGFERRPIEIVLQSKISENAVFCEQIEQKFSQYVNDSETKFEILQAQFHEQAESISDHLLALQDKLENLMKGDSVQTRPISGNSAHNRAQVASREISANQVTESTNRERLKTYFTRELLVFLRDATSKLENEAGFSKFCAQHKVSAGALIRALRKSYRGRQWNGAWWWTPGIAGRFPRPQ